MEPEPNPDYSYVSASQRPPILARWFPSLFFYSRFLPIVWRAGRLAKRGVYDRHAWRMSSEEVLHRLEQVGVRVHVQGLEHVKAPAGPVVLIGNHLSVMETVLLPSLVLGYRPITYVIKQSLLEVPVFKHVMKACRPIAVTRTNPRNDLKTVLEEGSERLAQGISVIIFPQTTRTAFNPEQFSSIGIKLAKKAGVPIVPIALLTDAWENGAWLKDFGSIRPEKTVQFAFGPALEITSKGNEEHQAVIDFIQHHLAQWQQRRLT